jgi:hypothetical protein
MSYEIDNGVYRIINNGFTTDIVGSSTQNTVLTAPADSSELVTDDNAIELRSKNILDVSNDVAANYIRIAGVNYPISGSAGENTVLTKVGSNLQFSSVAGGGGGITFRGEWVAGTYSKDDLVTYLGGLYIAIANSSTIPTNASFWTKIGIASVSGTGSVQYAQGGGLAGEAGFSFDSVAKTLSVVGSAPRLSLNVVGTGSIAAPQYTCGIGTGANIMTVSLGGATAFTVRPDSVIVPVGNTAGRPTVPAFGMLRYNTTENVLESYSPGAWMMQHGIIDKSVVSQTVTTSGNRPILTYTVPGGVLGSNNMLRVRTSGYWSNTSGGNTTVTLSVSYGGTVLYSDVSPAQSNGRESGWNIDLVFAANSSTTSQTLSGEMKIGGFAAANVGIGDLGSDEILSVAILYGSSSINSAVAQNFVVSVDVSRAGGQFVKLYHFIELI